MCAIFGSFSKEKLLELAKINSYRGKFSYSITTIDPITLKIREIVKGFGSFFEYMENSLNASNWIDGCYYVCHIQAPTSATTQDRRRIHPSELNCGEFGEEKTLLWHNGVLKHEWYTKSKFYDAELSWDTAVLHRSLITFDSLDIVDGQFSCVYYDDNGLYAFRNSEAPMFYDDELNISSTKFENSKSTVAGLVYRIDFKTKTFKQIDAFHCKSSAYYFGDDE